MTNGPKQKKVRSDAALKNLPAETQAELFAFCKGHSLDEARAWLKERGEKVCLSTISIWFSWYAATEQHRKDAAAVEGILEEYRSKHADISDEELFAIGQRIFSEMAIARSDAKTWVGVQGVTLTKNRGEFDKEKFEREIAVKVSQLKLEWDKHMDAAAERALDATTRALAEKIAASSMSNAEKIKAMRKAMFADVDAIADKVVIPK